MTWRWLAILLGVFFTQSIAGAQEGSSITIQFAQSDAALVNPERGFWRFAGDDFTKVSFDDLAQIRAGGVSVVYALVRLDAYRKQKLPPAFLVSLNGAFDAARKAGVKTIVRFVYNYPDSSSEYDNAKDAALPMVLRHIVQVGPVLNQNRDVIVVTQGGFIGAWGEQHTSSNGLDSDAAKRTIRDALLAALDPSIAIQWRYPLDIIGWQDERRKDVSTRTAFHNDCFLSSPTDVGTYDENSKSRAGQRTAMMALTAQTYFSGETCDAEKAQIRNDCEAVLKEGAQFHLSALGLDYYLVFHKKWKKQGCYSVVENKMGYRFALVSAQISSETSLVLRVKNDGWARLYKERVLKATVYDRAGAVLATQTASGLEQVLPNMSKDFRFEWKGQAKRVCIAAPDPALRLQDDVRYAIRFANQGSITWDDKTGQHCFAINE